MKKKEKKMGAQQPWRLPCPRWALSFSFGCKRKLEERGEKKNKRLSSSTRLQNLREWLVPNLYFQFSFSLNKYWSAAEACATLGGAFKLC
jgi:hypothetical protein